MTGRGTRARFGSGAVSTGADEVKIADDGIGATGCGAKGDQAANHEYCAKLAHNQDPFLRKIVAILQVGGHPIPFYCQQLALSDTHCWRKILHLAGKNISLPVAGGPEPIRERESTASPSLRSR